MRRTNLNLRLIAALLASASLLDAATKTVCASGCTTNDLQHALDIDAACGDEIQIKSTEIQTGNFSFTDRGCGSPITVTSDRSAWLPFVGTRITPSHLANMAIIRTSNSSPALQGVCTTVSVVGGDSFCTGVPPKHWRFIGLAFTSSYSGLTFNIVELKGNIATDATHVPDDIIFDRCYIFDPLPNGTTNSTNAIYADAQNLVFKNSHIGDIANPGQETHGIIIVTTPGPIDILNNYITASSIPIFTGGTIGDYPAIPSNITVEWNYTHRPPKWNYDPAQPFYADFLTNGSYTPCLKNHGEIKFGNTVNWLHNVHENMWNQPACSGQSNGFTNTIRTNWYSSVLDATMGDLTMSDTTHVAWSGSFNVDTAASLHKSSIAYGLCINFTSPTGLICRPFTTFNNTSKTITVSSAFPSAPGGPFEWWLSINANEPLNAISVRKNVYRNVWRPMNTLGTSASDGTSGAGRMTVSEFAGNLLVNTDTYFNTGASGTAPHGFGFGAAEDPYSFDPDGLLIDHNTIYNASGLGPMHSFLQFAAVSRGTLNRQPLWQNLDITNNIMGSPDSVYFPITGDVGTAINTVMTAYAANSSIQNNAMESLGSGSCTGTNTCSGNIVSAWVAPFTDEANGDFSVTSGSDYHNASLTGTDLGADVTQLASISYLSVTPGAATASLSFDLQTVNGDAGSTQPCVLEVSTSRNLHSDLDTYTVVNALNPTFFKQGDSSAGGNALLPSVTVSSGTVTWPIGSNSTVTGDDSVSHDLRLLSRTPHYGRVQCYGDTARFTFTTTGVAGGVSSGMRFSSSVKIGR